MNDENFDSEQFIRDFLKNEKDFNTEIDFMKNVCQNNNIMTTKEDSDNNKNIVWVSNYDKTINKLFGIKLFYNLLWFIFFNKYNEL